MSALARDDAGRAETSVDALVYVAFSPLVPSFH